MEQSRLLKIIAVFQCFMIWLLTIEKLHQRKEQAIMTTSTKSHNSYNITQWPLTVNSLTHLPVLTSSSLHNLTSTNRWLNFTLKDLMILNKTSVTWQFHLSNFPDSTSLTYQLQALTELPSHLEYKNLNFLVQKKENILNSHHLRQLTRLANLFLHLKILRKDYSPLFRHVLELEFTLSNSTTLMVSQALSLDHVL